MAIILSPGDNFATQLKFGILKDAPKVIARESLARIGKIKGAVADVLIEKVDNTAVIKSLLGQGSVDLAAHLGMTPEEVISFTDGIGDVISQEIVLVTSNNPNKFVTIKAVRDDFGKMLSLPGASHSTLKGIEIPVARWILINPNIDIGQAAFDIVFLGKEDRRFDNLIRSESRSGRALMILLENLSGGKPYVLPTIIRGRGGRNFITVALQTKKIRDQVGQAFKRATTT